MTWQTLMASIIIPAGMMACAVGMLMAAAKIRSRGEACWRIVGALGAVDVGIAVEMFLFFAGRIGRAAAVGIIVCALAVLIAAAFADIASARSRRRRTD